MGPLRSAQKQFVHSYPQILNNMVSNCPKKESCCENVINYNAIKCMSLCLCVSLCMFYSHQGHLRRLRPRLRCFLRLHRFMEQSVPHPRRLIQCQPADETLQTVNTRHHSWKTFVSMTYRRRKPHTYQVKSPVCANLLGNKFDSDSDSCNIYI